MNTESTATPPESPVAVPCSLLLGLIRMTHNESSKGDWRVSLDYDNYHDGACVLDGDGNVIGECYELPPEEMDPDQGVAWQFARAIETAIQNSENSD